MVDDKVIANPKWEAAMVKKKIINVQRVRRISGSFSFIPHRFLTDGFLALLNQQELLLYLFLVLASDRYGLSYYGRKRICSLLRLTNDEYLQALRKLIRKELIDFDGTVYQVLELPAKPKGAAEKPQALMAEMINKIAKRF